MMKTKADNVRIIISLSILFQILSLIYISNNQASLFPLLTYYSALSIPLFFSFKKIFLPRQYIIAFILSLIFFFLSLIYNHNEDLLSLPIIIVVFVFSYFLIKYRPNYFLSQLIFYTFNLYIIINWFVGILPLEIFSRVSNNNISSISLFLLTILAISARKDKYDIFIPSIVFLFVAMYASGRSGVISALFLIVMILLKKLYYSLKNKKFRNLISVSFIVIILVLILSYYSEIYEPVLNRFKSMTIQEDGRYQIIIEYIKSLGNVANLLLGTNKMSLSYLQYYNGNTHNSFINLHANFGLIAFVLIFYYSIKAIIYYAKNNYMYLIFFLTIIIRITFDMLSFIGLFDTLFLFFVLYPYFLKEKNKGDLYHA